MAERTTLKQAQAVFELLVKEMGGHVGRRYDDVGGLVIDYNPMYGGAVINEIVNTGGGVSQPFGSRRLPLGDFVTAMHFSRNVLRLASGR